MALSSLALALGCAHEEGSDRPSAVEPTHRSDSAPERCVTADRATRASLAGAPVWARFCSARAGLTGPAEVPTDALTTHLELLAGLEDLRVPLEDVASCRTDLSRTYRLQIGYADGIAQVAGGTDPTCVGRLGADGSAVRGPDGLGVYGLAMRAFGRQYADGFTAAPATPLTCPADPERPGSVDVDGASGRLGSSVPMLMPLSAERGMLCTWRARGAEPTSTWLSAAEADRVRIGMHAIHTAMVDCSATVEPTSTVVVEDRTGTRRAVSVVHSMCDTVIASDGRYGLGFPWLPPRTLPR